MIFYDQKDAGVLTVKAASLEQVKQSVFCLYFENALNLKNTEYPQPKRIINHQSSVPWKS